MTAPSDSVVVAVQDSDVEAAKVAAKVSPWPELARAVVIFDQASFDAAAELLLGIKALEDEVHSVFDPMAEAAHAAHRKITAQRAAQLKPLADAEAVLKKKISEFCIEQERLARIEQERLEQIALAEAAAALEVRIEQAEANGATADEIAVIVDDAPPPALVAAAPAVQTKGSGISQRSEWVAEVDGERGLALLIQAAAKTHPLRVLLKVDETKLRAMTKALGAEMKKIPGLKVYQRPIVSVRK